MCKDLKGIEKTMEHEGGNYTNRDWYFGTVTKCLLKGLEDLEVGGRAETIQTAALLRTARILRGVLETCCHSDSSEKQSAKTDVKNSQGVNHNYMAKKSTTKQRRKN